MDPWVGFISPDAAYCIGRALIIGIVLSSELAVAGRKRVGFERHLLLGLGLGLFLLAELFVGAIGILRQSGLHLASSRLSFLYPALCTAGLALVIFACDFCRFQGDDVRIRRRARTTLAAVAALVLLGLGLAVFGPTGAASQVRSRLVSAPPGSVQSIGIGAWSVALHGIQAAAAVWLLMAVRHHDPGLVTMRQSHIFMFGCVAYVAGALLQLSHGPREHLTTLAHPTRLGHLTTVASRIILAHPTMPARLSTPAHMTTGQTPTSASQMMTCPSAGLGERHSAKGNDLPA